MQSCTPTLIIQNRAPVVNNMGSGQSTLFITIKGDHEHENINVPDPFKILRKTIPEHLGRLSFHLVRENEKIYFYVRCPGKVKEFEFLMYAWRKSNGNFQIFKRNTNKNPIDYIKRRNHAYEIYGKKKRRRRSYLGKISMSNGVTEIEIPRHAKFNDSDFVSPLQEPIIENHKNVRIDAYGKLVWASYQIGVNEFRLDCSSPFSWLQAFAFAAVVWQQ